MMRENNIHINIYISEIKHEDQQTINNNVITEFDNLTYIFGPLSQWDLLFLFKSFQVHHESANGLQN